MLSSVDCITTTSVSEFLVHTAGFRAAGAGGGGLACLAVPRSDLMRVCCQKLSLLSKKLGPLSILFKLKKFRSLESRTSKGA
jgi:hypothetical protein